MGQSSSATEGKVLEQQYQSSLSLFSTFEQGELRKIFDKICHESGTDEGFQRGQLQTYIGGKLPESTTTRLYQLLKLLQLCGTNTKPDQDVAISHHAFVVAMAMMFKGTLDQHCHLIHCLATENRDGVPMEELTKFVGSILQHYENALKLSDKMNNWQMDCDKASHEKLVQFVLHNALELTDGDSSKILDESDLSRWLQKEPLFQTLLVNIFHVCFSPPEGDQGASASTDTAPQDDVNISTLQETNILPQCLNMNWNSATTILDLPSVLLLNNRIPHACRGQWRHLFSSQTDGASFATMARHIMKQGPVILIVRDTDGHVFGGFASQSLQFGPSFTGTSQSFLFSLEPSYGIYEATGQNDHFVYFNTDQQTIPNGLGMGGQFNYFGFWLYQDFGTGHSRANPKCATYDSPQLSGQEKFKIDIMEAWAVGPPPKVKEEDLYEEDQTSILDRDPEAQAILDLVGKTRKSEGLRDEEPTADIPDVHKMPPI